MREFPTQSDRNKCNLVYDFIAAHPGVYLPCTTVAAGTGLSEQDVVVGFYWALELRCPKSGIYMGSKRGRNGGYFVADDKLEAADDATRSLLETHTHLRKDLNKTKSLRKRKWITQTEFLEHNNKLDGSIKSIELSLAHRGHVIGHVAAAQAAEEAEAINRNALA